MTHDRPTPAELVAAVREFLEQEILPATEGQRRFHSLVAVNVLAIVERELTTPADPLPAALLQALGCTDDTDLVDALRTGRITPATPGLRPYLDATTTARLSVSAPRHPFTPGAPVAPA